MSRTRDGQILALGPVSCDDDNDDDDGVLHRDGGYSNFGIASIYNDHQRCSRYKKSKYLLDFTSQHLLLSTEIVLFLGLESSKQGQEIFTIYLFNTVMIT